MNMLAKKLECRRTAKRLMRFLDRDPSAPLTDEDRERVRIHLDECRKCASIAEEFTLLHDELRTLGDAVEVPPESISRIKQAVRRTLDNPESHE